MHADPDLEIALTTVTPGTLRLFSLYVDFPGSVSARWLTVTISRMAGPAWRTPSEMWKLDSLISSDRIRHLATGEAANADVIIIAVSSLAQPEPALIHWLDSLAGAKSGQPGPGLLIALLGDTETKSAQLDWAVKPLIHCARRIGRDFIWHWMGDPLSNDPVWLSENVDTLLARKRAAVC